MGRELHAATSKVDIAEIEKRLTEHQATIGMTVSQEIFVARLRLQSFDANGNPGKMPAFCLKSIEYEDLLKAGTPLDQDHPSMTKTGYPQLQRAINEYARDGDFDALCKAFDDFGKDLYAIKTHLRSEGKPDNLDIQSAMAAQELPRRSI
jgi:hypothetical protein